ncbi:MAG TPA: DUF5130 family protein [Pseudonocardiaceae bacterium]|nr:DUF5130 family protein [Pseudonocardiaceae bacterium]
MATGDQHSRQEPHGEQSPALASGEAVVGSGRISAARRVTPVLPRLPFTRSQLARIEDALSGASRRTGLNVSVYLGDLGDDTRAGAEDLLDSLGERAATAVLVAVSPGQRVVEVITGPDARHRLTDRDCKLAVMSMVASFEQGDLAAGLVNGLRMITDHAASTDQG